MESVVTRESAVTVFSVTGRLDALAAPDMEGKLNRWLEQNETKLVIDMRGLDYISSAGLRVLLSAAKKIKARGGVLFLAHLQTCVMHVFEISGFSSIIPIYETVEAARDAAK
jgi:anti-anti-sigma factor